MVYMFGVGLLGLGALRGLCGFCARVELGGLKACGVFASVIPLFAFVFLLFAYLLGLCLCCSRLVLLPALFVLVCLWVFVCVVVSFSLTDDQTKRKGAVPCVLSSCVACVQSLVQLSKNSLAVYLAFSSSFGW